MSADAAEMRPTRNAVGGWLAARNMLQLVALSLGAIVSISVLIGGIMALGAKLAERDFLTVAGADRREAVLAQRLETRIASGEALTAQRETSLVQQIETMGAAQEAANARMQASIDRIYNLLLQRHR